MAGGSFRKFIKGYDRYSKPVTLTYNHAGSFKTVCGGIATIVTSFIFCAWIALEVFDVFAFGGKYSQSTKVTTIYDIDDGQYPVYELDRDELLITSRLISSDPNFDRSTID